MQTNSQNPAMQQILEQAKEAFKRMPALGPVAWLYGRTPGKQTLTLQDLDWAVMPPLVLEQCRLFMNGEMPFGYISWAFVSDEVSARLKGGDSKLQPHEWHGGEHAWLIDMVMPFGETEQILAELKRSQFPNRTVEYIDLNAAGKPVTKSL